jgi:hypothetical protein
MKDGSTAALRHGKTEVTMLVKLKIFRFDPEKDKEPYQTYEVEADPIAFDCLNRSGRSRIPPFLSLVLRPWNLRVGR